MLSFMIQHEDATEIYINELLKVPSQNPEQESYWFPTPEEPGILQHILQSNNESTMNSSN